MEFRFMKDRSVLLLPDMVTAISRNIGLGVAVCALLATSAHAQATLDFLDPLENERTRIEQAAEPAASPSTTRPDATRELPPPRLGDLPGPDSDSMLVRARDGAAAGASVAKDGASGFWSTLRAKLSSVATALSLPLLGLVALLVLLLAGLAALVGWTLFRGRGRRPIAASTPNDVYARSLKDARKRRAPGSAVPERTGTARKEADHDDFEETDFEETDFEETDFEETMPEDFDSIFVEENDESTKRRTPGESTDPDTWRKPNLDRLRDSIKADWKAEKEEKKKDESVAPLAPPRATAVAADPATRTLDDLSDGWEEWDSQDNPEDDPWGETAPTRKAAVEEDDEETSTRRIRALRDSLRAS